MDELPTVPFFPVGHAVVTDGMPGIYSLNAGRYGTVIVPEHQNPSPDPNQICVLQLAARGVFEARRGCSSVFLALIMAAKMNDEMDVAIDPTVLMDYVVEGDVTLSERLFAEAASPRSTPPHTTWQEGYSYDVEQDWLTQFQDQEGRTLVRFSPKAMQFLWSLRRPHPLRFVNLPRFSGRGAERLPQPLG